MNNLIFQITIKPLGLRGGEISPPPVQDSRFMILSIANKGKILWKFLKFDHKIKAKEKFMAHNKTQPLYMYLAFQSVHRPLQAPAMYTRLYDGQGLTGPQKVRCHFRG